MVYYYSYADRRAALLRKVSKNSTYIIEKKEVQEARLRHEFWKNRISKKKGKLSSRFSPPHFIPRSPSHIHHDVEDTTCPLLSRNKRLRALSRWWRCNNHSSSSEEPNGVSRVCRKAERLLVGERVNKKNACVNCFLKKRLFVSSKRSDISSKRQIFWIFLPLFCGEDSELVPTLSSRHNLYIYTHTRIKRAHRRSICTYETRATKRSENFFFSFACRAKRERAFYI